MLRKLAIILSVIGCALATGLPAVAQAPPAVPPLPDSERRVAYAPSAAVGPFAITFALYGSGTDYGNWIEVWLNGARLVPITDFTVTLTSGTMATAARPMTNAQVTLTVASTGTLQIVGAERPRRLAQFANNQPVAARDLNVVFTDLVAMLREVWDKINDVTGRVFMAPPGETLAALPPAATRANLMPCFDAGGQLTTCAPLATGLPVVAGQGITVAGSTLSTSAGVDTDILATGTTIVAAPTVNSTFCGKTAALGGAAFYTFTVGAASGFSANCSIVITNIDAAPPAGRAKKMAISGVTFQNDNMLYPGQSFALRNVANVWVPTYRPWRYRLGAQLDLYVSTSVGNDGNDGLAAGAGNALATMQKCADVVIRNIDLAGQRVYCNVAAGNYPENIYLGNFVGINSIWGYNQVTFLATDPTPANTKMNPPSGPAAFITGGGSWTFEGFRCESTGPIACAQADSGGAIALRRYEFGAIPGGTHMVCQFSGSRVAIIGPDPYTIVGSASIHEDAQYGCNILHQPGLTATISNSPTFAVFSRATKGAVILNNGTNYVNAGTVTGQKFIVDNNGVIDTQGAIIPGSTAGAVYDGGVINGGTTGAQFGFSNNPRAGNVGIPAITCNAGSPSISGTDSAGTFTTGAGSANCTVVFVQNPARTNAMYCQVSQGAKASNLDYTTTNTQITLSSVSANAVYFYSCIGNG